MKLKKVLVKTRVAALVRQDCIGGDEHKSSLNEEADRRR
jgi:hypothetical protein